MRPVGISKMNIFDEGYFFQHIFAGVSFVQPAIDDREGQGLVVLEENEHRHLKLLVHLTGDVSQVGAGVMVGL